MRIGSHWKHVKRGTVYELVGRAKMQIGIVPDEIVEQLEKLSFVVYRALADGTLWVRPEKEFIDGRFVEIK